MMRTMIVIPAAGASRRMGGDDKLLRHVDGVALIRRTALHALATGQDVVVTLRPEDSARRAALAGLALHVLSVDDAAVGLSASLRRAASAAGPDTALMVLPADMPEVNAADLTHMWGLNAAHPDRIVQGMSGAVPGHPVIFPPDLVSRFGQLRGDTGARDILAMHRDRLLPVPLFGHRATLDLDTPQDWADWSAMRASTSLPGTIQTDPIALALQDPQECAIALITAVHGTGLQQPGAMMCLWRDGRMSGQLTGGCIEGDLACHLADVLEGSRPVTLRYGAGSPFFDIRLPCGGGLDILLCAVGNAQALSDIACLGQGRVAAALRVRPDGALQLDFGTRTGWDGADFVLARKPDTRFIVFGAGAEARQFCQIAQAAGYCVVDAGQAARLSGAGDTDRDIPNAEDILLLADAQTAVLTFLHDHDTDAAIIAAALRGPAWYVGALGSRRTAAQRLRVLQDSGLDRKRLARLHAPVGLVPATRDSRGLAISVLAEVLALELAAQDEGNVAPPATHAIGLPRADGQAGHATP